MLAAKSAGDFLITEKSLPQADAIYVLSGSAVYDERTIAAAELYRTGLARKIVVTNDGEQSGWQESIRRNPYSWEWERASLLTAGVPDADIEVLYAPIVKGTHDETDLLAKIAAERDWHSVMIVTSPFHTRRALWAASRSISRQQLNLEIGIFPANKENLTRNWWLSAKNWRNVASECLKFADYWVSY